MERVIMPKLDPANLPVIYMTTEHRSDITTLTLDDVSPILPLFRKRICIPKQRNQVPKLAFSMSSPPILPTPHRGQYLPLWVTLA